MTDYLSFVRQTLTRRILVRLIASAALMMLSCLLFWLLFLSSWTDTHFRIVPPVGIYTRFLVLTPTVFLLLIRYSSTFTLFSGGISLGIALLQGGCMGCAAALLTRGLLTGYAPVQLYGEFLVSLLLLALSALSDVYADCFLPMSVRELGGSVRDRRAIFREYTVLFCAVAGLILLIRLLLPWLSVSVL